MKKHPTNWTPAVGDVVEIAFHDHGQVDGAGADALDFTVYGRLHVITKRSYTVHSWAYTDPDEDIGEHDVKNIEGSLIVRSAITDMYRLSRPKQRRI
jgi:hypothetical protein